MGDAEQERLHKGFMKWRSMIVTCFKAQIRHSESAAAGMCGLIGAAQSFAPVFAIVIASSEASMGRANPLEDNKEITLEFANLVTLEDGRGTCWNTLHLQGLCCSLPSYSEKQLPNS